MSIIFEKAVRSQVKFRGAFTGPSGSGKTFSALLMASGMAKKIALVDTENHSASLYAGIEGIPDFDTVGIEPPYTVAKYMQAMDAAAQAGYDMTIIDSITHAWAGDGGLLSKKESMDVRGGNHFTNWAPITKEHEQFKAKLLHPDTHLIVTMRSKQDYILQDNGSGKQAPKKVGMAPIQREGMEYEFDLVLDLGMDHTASISKGRIHWLDGQMFKPTRQTGADILAWLKSGTAEQAKPAVSENPPVPSLKNKLIIPSAVEVKTNSKNEKFWIIVDVAGPKFYTFDAEAGALLGMAAKHGQTCLVDVELTAHGSKIVSARTEDGRVHA